MLRKKKPLIRSKKKGTIYKNVRYGPPLKEHNENSLKDKKELDARDSKELDPKITELLTQGEALLENEDYNAASQCYYEILELDLKEEKAWVGLTKALLKLEKFTELETKLLEVKKAKITYPVIYLGLAAIYRFLNNKPRFKGIEKEGLDKHPRNLWLLKLFAEYHNEEDNFRKAVDLYERILEQEPDNSEILFNCGYIYSEFKDYKKSNSYYKRLLSIDPNDHVAMYNLGVNYVDMNLITKAMSCFKKSLEIEPEDEQAIKNLMDARRDRINNTMKMTEEICIKEMQEILLFDSEVELKEFLIDFQSDYYEIHFDDELITFTRIVRQEEEDDDENAYPDLDNDWDDDE